MIKMDYEKNNQKKSALRLAEYAKKIGQNTNYKKEEKK